MITSTQRDVLGGLEALLSVSDLRVGQLVAFLGDLAEDMNMRGLGDIEDDELLVVMARLRKDWEPRFSDAAESA
jgi:hypothetical protein